MQNENAQFDTQQCIDNPKMRTIYIPTHLVAIDVFICQKTPSPRGGQRIRQNCGKSCALSISSAGVSPPIRGRQFHYGHQWP